MFVLLIATSIDIGLEQTAYTTHDNADYQVVCADVQSGSANGREIEINYVVKDNGIIFGPFVMYNKLTWNFFSF